jgi:probable F420-dependent oxidoreductase
VQRLGMTIPAQTLPLREQEAWVRDLPAMGFADVWTPEANDLDGLIPLALASQWAPALRLGTAVIPVQTRGPALLAMSAASLCQAAPGRFVLGIGVSSPFIVTALNGRPYERPLATVRDAARFLRAALRGEKLKGDHGSFSVRGFRLLRSVEPPPILIAALRPGMLDLAGREADGAILNWFTPSDLSRLVPLVKKHGAEKEIAGRINVCPTRDAEAVRAIARASMAAYLSAPAYRAQQEWLGRGHLFEAMWSHAERGDWSAARAAIPDELVDLFYIHGPPERCRERIQEYLDGGLETAIIGLTETGLDPREASRLLALE